MSKISYFRTTWYHEDARCLFSLGFLFVCFFFFLNHLPFTPFVLNCPGKIRSPFKGREFLLSCVLSHCQISASTNCTLGCWKKVRQPRVSQMETEVSEAVWAGTALLLAAGIRSLPPERSLALVAYGLGNNHEKCSFCEIRSFADKSTSMWRKQITRIPQAERRKHPWKSLQKKRIMTIYMKNFNINS